jgi:hypothetical protein
MIKKPYAQRSDLEKIHSQWHKLSGLHTREEWSAAIVRAATAAELEPYLVSWIRFSIRSPDLSGQDRGYSAIEPDSSLYWRDKITDHYSYNDPRKARSSGLGFHGVARAGDSPARRQNNSSASRFICKFVAIYRLVVAMLAWPR